VLSIFELNIIQCDFKYAELHHQDLDNQIGNTLTLNTVKCYQNPTIDETQKTMINRKRGDEIKKNTSPLKLLSQSQPNFAEMILG
jgi:hypothetical protein